jgi:hypothetical protein
VLLATLLTGCAVPIGPRFQLRSRQITFNESPASSAPVHLRVTEQMQNNGNRPLAFLDVSLPYGVGRAGKNLAIRIDGKPAVPLQISEDPAAPLRVQFNPPWPMRQIRQIVLEYDLSSNPVSGGVAGVMTEGFYLADPHALPRWITPVGLFSGSDVLSRDERFEISLPADFRIVASGKQQKRRAPGGKVLYRFRTSGGEMPSFVIGGRYVEQIVHTPGGNVVFWTFRPLDSDVAQKIAGRLAAASATFAQRFGTFPKLAPPRIVEAPAGLLAPDAWAASFPEGLLLAPRAFEKDNASESALQAAEAEMVRIWFGWRVPLDTEIQTLLGRGLGMFGVVLAAEVRGGQPARRAEIARLLTEFDKVRPAGGDVSLLRPPEQCTPEQLYSNTLKSALFLAALADLAGLNDVEKSFQTLQRAMSGRGLMLNLDELRSSLEAATGTPMAGFFRLWLNLPGVPDDFRERYRTSSQASLVPAPGQSTLMYAAPQDATQFAAILWRRP